MGGIPNQIAQAKSAASYGFLHLVKEPADFVGYRWYYLKQGFLGTFALCSG